MHVFLFGGTTEGRKIAEAIAEVNRERAAQDANTSEPLLHADIFVATAYGASLLPVGPGMTVHVGRLDASEMMALFSTAWQKSDFVSDETTGQQLQSRPEEISRATKKFELPKSSGLYRIPETAGQDERGQRIGPVVVIDATHPYAAVVSENILSACTATGIHCIRVEREDFGTEEKETASEVKATGAEEKTAAPEGAALHWVDSIEGAATWLAQEISEGVHRPNILITTGSKELEPYTWIPDFEARCYVRALPTVEALEKCQRLGFRRAHLILMQGPFSEEMNIAQLRYAHAGYLVTKASGETGGFPEKCEAALALGVEVICIGRPKEVSIPASAWYDRRKLDAVLRLIREC